LTFTYLFINYISCRPTPHIQWSKPGSELPEGRATIEVHEKTLKIENISYQDRGNYRCTANNLLGKASHDFHVTVEGTPSMRIYVSTSE
jgi:neuropilin 2